MDTQQTPEVTRGLPLAVFLKFTIPNILSIVAISSSGIVDAMFLGQYAGTSSLAAVNIINPMFSFCFGLSIMLTIGGAVRAGKYIGEGRIKEASSIFTKTITAIIIFSIIISSAGIFFSGEVAGLLGANAELLPLSSKYLSIIAFFIMFNTVGYGLSVFVRIDGRPFLASAGLVSMGLTNILLDWILVGLLGKGVEGAAIATGIAGFIGFTILSTHFIAGRSKMKIAFGGGGWLELLSSAYNGLSELISEMSVGIIMLSFNKIMIARFDTAGVAAFTAINYLMWGGGMINYATADSLNPLVSINYGAKKPDRIIKFIKLAASFVLTNGLVIFTILTVMPEVLISIFIADKSSEAFVIALKFSSYVRWAFFFNGMNQILSAYFTAIHRPLESAIVSSARGLILPLLFLSVFPMAFGDYGIFAAVPCSEVLTFLAAIFLWKYNKPSKITAVK